MNKKVIIAAAGSGKTEKIVEEALKCRGSVLITTFTDKNVEEITNRLYQENGTMPSNITILPWYTFLLKHLVKPYQDVFFKQDIKGVHLTGGQSTTYISHNDIKNYYFHNEDIYADKIAAFAIKCNNYYNGKPIVILSQIFQYILIDEIQDFSGYDLDILKLLILYPKIELLCVGDPRQGVFVTSKSNKNKQYSRSLISIFFQEMKGSITIDDTSLRTNYRCTTDICLLSDLLYPKFPSVICGNNNPNEHLGVFFVRKKNVNEYLNRYNPVQLRWSKNTSVNETYIFYNFGEAKGQSFNRVLIYPTPKMLKWLLCNTEITQEIRAKLYVALTRARYSVGIIYDYSDEATHNIIQKYK